MKVQNNIHFNCLNKQIVSLVTNVVIQIAQLQFCTKNLPEKHVQVKSDLSKPIAETAKKYLGVNKEGKDLFEFIILRPAPPPPSPFVFSSKLVEKKKAPFQASTVLSKVTKTPLATSSNSTKSTKKSQLRFSTQVFFEIITPTEQDRIHQTVIMTITNK